MSRRYRQSNDLASYTAAEIRNGDIWTSFMGYTSGQTNRKTDRHTYRHADTILCTSVGGELKSGMDNRRSRIGEGV